MSCYFCQWDGCAAWATVTSDAGRFCAQHAVLNDALLPGEADAIRSLTVGPDDVIVVTLADATLDPAARDAIGATLTRQWPGHVILCVTPDVTLEALPPAEMARYGWVRAGEGA